MGTWCVKIDGNDTFQDIYVSFFDLYNDGLKPTKVSEHILEQYSEMFNDYDDRNNCLFGLAIAQWETQSLDSSIYARVKEIIENESDIEMWREQGADSNTLEERRVELLKFLDTISVEREKVKRRKKKKFEFSENYLVSLRSPDKNKTLDVAESFVNGLYKGTNASLKWETGGGTVFHFFTINKNVSARWISSEELEIRHDKTIEFSRKDEKFFYGGDQGIVTYIGE